MHLLDSHTVVVLCKIGYVEKDVYGEFNDLVLSFLSEVLGEYTGQVQVSQVDQLESPLWG